MLICDVKAHPIDLPLRKPFKYALTELRELDYGIVEVIGDGGATGYGEYIGPKAVTGEIRSGYMEIVETIFKPLLIGQKINSLDEASELALKLDSAIALNPSTKASVEVAILDLLGKTLNSPIHALLGKKKRDFIPVTYVLPMECDINTEVSEACALGFTRFKLKVGLDDEKDLYNIARLRDILADIPFGIDVNQAWRTPVKSLAMISKIEGPSWIEDPVRDPLDLAAVKKESKIPIMADACLWGPETAKLLIELDACDIFNLKLHEAGGILRSLKVLEIAEANSIPCIVGSCFETEIGTAACVHFACLSDAVITTELVGLLEIEKRIGSGIQLLNAMLNVPSGDGLGLNVLPPNELTPIVA